MYFQEQGLSRWAAVERGPQAQRLAHLPTHRTHPGPVLTRRARLSLDGAVRGCGSWPWCRAVDPGGRRPFVVVQARLGDRHRIRKRGLECDGRTSLCCRQQFFIDFRLAGWNDWIIRPPATHGNYCEGSCPAYLAGVPGSASSFHTAVVSQYRMRGLNPGTVNSCCIPTKLSTMSMLYFGGQYNVVQAVPQYDAVEKCVRVARLRGA